MAITHKISLIVSWFFLHLCMDVLVTTVSAHKGDCHFARLYGHEKIKPGPNDKPD